jgi:hypothetical protein
MDPVAERDQVWAAWWQEKQDEVTYSFLVQPQNQGGAAEGSGGQPESARGVWLVYSTKPTPSRDDVAAKSYVGLSHKTNTGGSAGGDGIRARREASKRATCGMIEVLALGGREGPMDARSYDGELHVLTKMPL